MSSVSLIFPHQLFEHSPLFENDNPIYLIEEHLFFNQYPFHKQKIAFHRASMKCYENFLNEKNIEVEYISATVQNADIRMLIPVLKKMGFTHVQVIDPVDYWLTKRILEGCKRQSIECTFLQSPGFLNSNQDLATFFRPDKKKYHQTTFYKSERKRRKILLENNGDPIGGKWTFDTENRKKYPAKKTPPAIHYPNLDNYFKEAKKYVEKHFTANYGSLENYPLYPISFADSQDWFTRFLNERFMEFGTYEDAIVVEHSILHHSVLTPMLNVGLITPDDILNQSLAYAKEHNVPINSTEGFVRQIIGWREFIRGMYICRGRDQRTVNFWQFKKKIPSSFYDGTTGIYPIDQTIKKVLKTGYCHHIERLMVLSNFMMLCEFDPDEVYRWFMELFIDAYDWVMVPNIYGMSQFSDGGLMTTKPYISGSNYLMKMGNYKKADWQKSWDGLFWRFMDKHRGFFLQNPRLSMLIRTFDKMPQEKREAHITNGEEFLNKL